MRFPLNCRSKTGRIKSEFRHDICALNADVDLDTAGPIVLASTVLGYNGWLVGYQLRFDSQKSKITKNNIALGYSSGDFILHTNVNDGQEFGGSIYQKVSPKLDTAIDLNWTAGSNETRFGIGCKYELDKEASVRAKVNNLSQIGLGYQQKLREGRIQVISLHE
ncbi:voltage-dependent anion-selective channel protein 2 [Cryptotermes secundus]|uniref:voltage-dependent anion-selective channel protein 2 n=1 Tax=Cryptotermes secundus TaxID=105785 RepID=UPI001454D2F0|nr:voltage-dependent anion-selective channel protein 2 [Cryptotermes secundus]